MDVFHCKSHSSRRKEHLVHIDYYCVLVIRATGCVMNVFPQAKRLIGWPFNKNHSRVVSWTELFRRGSTVVFDCVFILFRTVKKEELGFRDSNWVTCQLYTYSHVCTRSVPYSNVTVLSGYCLALFRSITFDFFCCCCCGFYCKTHEI